MNRILNAEVLTSHGNIEGRKLMTELMDAGLTAADPYWKARDLMHREGNLLYVGNTDFEPIGSPRTGEDVFDLDKDIDRVFIIGAGKGIWRAVQTYEEILGEYLTGGQVILKYGDIAESEKIGIVWASHPVPDENCVEGCRRIVSFIQEQKFTERDLVITVVGNGVSSLLTLPPEELNLDDVMNIVRNQVDILKGGRITRMMAPAKMIHTFTIDINEQNDNFGVVGYKARTEYNEWLHTLPDISTPQMAIEFLKNNDMWKDMSENVRNYLENGATEHPVMKLEEFERLDCRIYGLMAESRSFVPAVKEKAKELGIEPHFMTKQYFSEAGSISKLMCSIAKLIETDDEPFKAPCVLIFTGEALVSVGKNGGVGGRNQEICVTAAKTIADRKRIVVGAADTDGTDGPGGFINDDAEAQGVRILAGGIVDGFTLAEANEKGIDLDRALRTHATSDPLWKLNSAIVATQNISINDLVLLLITK